MRNSLQQGVHGWITSVLQIKFWYICFSKSLNWTNTHQEKIKCLIDLFMTRGKWFEVICTLELEMVTWKFISIKASKVFITGLNQLGIYIYLLIYSFFFIAVLLNKGGMYTYISWGKCQSSIIALQIINSSFLFYFAKLLQTRRGRPRW